MGIVYGNGINNMSRGWASENELNDRVYRIWRCMIRRCYDKKYKEKHPTYKNCIVCDRWLLLSNFVHDFKSIDGYDEEKFLNGELELDKDIKTNGVNKEYSLENCTWVSHIENVRQAMKTRDRYGENHPMYNKRGKDNPLSIKIAQYDKKENLIKVWDCSQDIKRELKINNGNIISCCKFYEMNCNIEEWHNKYKDHPRKSVGGFIWKYYKEDD